MRKRFAPLALLFGLLTAMMLGSTAVAQANPILTTFTSCTNGVVNVNVVTCNDVLNGITVTITGNDVLSNNELTTLKDSLNGNEIDILTDNEIDLDKVDIFLGHIEALAATTYNSFNPPINITVGNVNVCIVAICK